MEIQNNVNTGLLQNFLEHLPERALRLSLRIVLAGLAFLIGIQLIRLIRHILKKALLKSKVDESASCFIDSFVKYLLYFILILTIAASLGVDATSILALLGSASVAIGLAVQGSLSNLIGGIMILVLKPFSSGDYIMDSQGNEGKVDAIDVIYTHLRTLDNKMIVLPNGTLANSSVVNYTKCKERRIDIRVGIAYEEDIRKVREVILALLEQDENILANKEKKIVVDSLGDSSVNLSIMCWVTKKNYWEMKWKLTEQIKYALDDAGIRIPFPQLDVHNVDVRNKNS